MVARGISIGDSKTTLGVELCGEHTWLYCRHKLNAGRAIADNCKSLANMIEILWPAGGMD